MKTFYLDNNATTKVAPEVLEAMTPFFSDFYGNPSSAHSFGGSVAEQIDRARDKVASLLGAGPEEIIFTSCGTESDNAAIRSASAANPEKRHVVTSAVEHPAVRSFCRYLAEQGYRITEVPVNKDGELDMAAYKASLSPDTALVTLMWANNETGVIFPIEEAAHLAHEKRILFHTDAVQAVGKIPINLKECSVDMLSLSGHKLHGPKGIGVLYVRRGVPFHPMLIGGHQEEGRRGGTENTASIIGLGKACELAALHMKEENTRVKALRDKLEKGILSNVSHARVNGKVSQRLPNTSCVSFDYVEGEGILLLLDELGICASSGSACSTGSTEPSHVLTAMDVPALAARGAIRFSLSIYNSPDEIDYVSENIPGIIEKLRSMSPLRPQNKVANG